MEMLTPEQLAAVLVAWVGSVFGIATVTNLLMKFVKWVDERLEGDILSPEQELKVTGWVAEALVLVITSGLGYLVNTYLLGQLQLAHQYGAWPIVLAAWYVARDIYTKRKKLDV